MYKIYGDWLLVIAAYNCGAGNVNKAIKRAGGQKDFWAISRYLPAETRGYVPAFIAVTYVMNYSTEHHIFPVEPAFNYFEVDTVAIDRNVSLKKIADAIDLPLDVVTYLNPIYKRGVIPDTENSNYLRLPTSKLAAFIAAEPTLYDPIVTPVPQFASNTVIDTQVDADAVQQLSADGSYKMVTKKVKKNYTVRSGDNLSALSKKFDCTTADLKSWNKLNKNTLLKGQRLTYYTQVTVKVPVPSSDAVAKNDSGTSQPDKIADSSITSESSVAQTKTTTTTNQPGVVYHMVQKGDTLWNIAQRYEGATVEQIMKINKINNTTNLKPGTKLKVKVTG